MMLSNKAEGWGRYVMSKEQASEPEQVNPTEDRRPQFTEASERCHDLLLL